MLQAGLLRDVAVVLAASFPVLFLCRKLRLPQIVGFLLTGVAIGPHALGWLSHAGRVEAVAELGVALILFFVGLEFPLKRLVRLGRAALLGGSLQIVLTAGTLAGLGFLAAASPRQALFHGMILAVSSTAVVLPILKERDELASPWGRTFLAVALFQDLATIPVLLLLPALSPAATGISSGWAIAGRVAAALFGVVLLVAVARRTAPQLLDVAARLGSRETFTGGVIVVVLLIVALAEKAGVSAAMGAFAAGIVLGESDHVHEVGATLAPLKDLLSSLFFVSIGMLLYPADLAAQAAPLALAVVAVLLVKGAAAFAALNLAGVVPRTALRASLALATVGEFSFVLARAGASLGLLSEGTFRLFVGVAVVTMALAPVLVAIGPKVAVRLPERVEAAPEGEEEKALDRHIVIAGAGLNGTNVGRVLAEVRIPYVIVDIDPDRVLEARREGLRALRADATGAEGLEAAGIRRATGAVITIPDPDAARRAVRLCRMRNPGARVIVRTRYVREVEALRAVGADEIIPEEFETSLEILSRVLHLFHVPGNVVGTQIRLLRDEAYRRLRDPASRTAGGRRLSALVAAGTTELFLVMPDTPADGQSLSRLDLGADHVAVPAVLRDGVPFAPPSPDMRIAAGDTLLLVGAHEDLLRVLSRLER